MIDAQFPSGPWTGYYNYQAGGRRHRMDMSLTFKNGKIDGEGCDDVGIFVVDGHFDAEVGDCWWSKKYVGAHEVDYRGYAENRGIWGTWSISAHGHGGFQIWPAGEEPAEEAAVAKEQSENRALPQLNTIQSELIPPFDELP